MPAPPTDELREFIEDPLASKLETNREIRNKERRRTRIFTVAYATIFVIVAIAVTASLGIGSDEGFLETYWVTFALIFGGILLHRYLSKRYFAERLPFDYRSDIAVPLVHFIEPRMTVRDREEFPPGELEATGLFSADMAVVEVDDWFERGTDSPALRLAELRCAGPRRGMLRLERTFDFRGLFVAAATAGSFEGHTVITPRCDSTPWFPADLDEHRSVDVDDPDLADAFDIRSTSPAAAADLLNTDLVEHLRALRTSIAGDESPISTPEGPSFAVVLRDDRLFVLRPAPRYFGRTAPDHTTDSSHLHRIGRELCTVIDLAEWAGSLDFDKG